MERVATQSVQHERHTLRPKVIAHNSISLDGAYRDFAVDLALHYETAEQFAAPVRLIGSITAATGLGPPGSLPLETEQDRSRPPIDSNDARPFWVVVDSTGRLRGLLHAIRSSGHCRDVAVLISDSTPRAYIEYLQAREYDCFVAGASQVDLERGLRELGERYAAPSILVDSGPTLVGALLQAGVLDELSLIVTPRVTTSSASYFARFPDLSLELLRSTELRDGHIHSVYGVQAVEAPRA